MVSEAGEGRRGHVRSVELFRLSGGRITEELCKMKG